MESARNLLSDLANPFRIKIMQILDESPNTFTDIARKLSISNSEVSRYISRLTEHKFIVKHSRIKKFELTPFERMILLFFSPIMYILDNNEYFKIHDFLDLPFNLISEINSLSRCEFINGTGKVMLKL